MEQSLLELSQQIQQLAVAYVPKAYQLGREKAKSRYGIVVPWRIDDAANVELLLMRHARELSRSFARMDSEIADGRPKEEVLTKLRNTLGNWAWVLAPALAMGLAAYVDATRTEIGREEKLPAEEIGVLWLTARDAKVCPKCRHLNGRWFPAKEAYELAATVHPGCRCPAHFDVGVPSDAMVGPLEDTGVYQHVYAGLGG